MGIHQRPSDPADFLRLFAGQVPSVTKTRREVRRRGGVKALPGASLKGRDMNSFAYKEGTEEFEQFGC